MIDKIVFFNTVLFCSFSAFLSGFFIGFLMKWNIEYKKQINNYKEYIKNIILKPTKSDKKTEHFFSNN